ncbi:flavodoxin domain-containing protein [Companilactobacillus metriopterae]|uniref:flavodoxin domain-containing protein n=1 Tax=Companilactobacillus metriopterae TaxID=1909267 RepID=UPI00100A8D52|nr:flavodoxin domain-containing protein [Companilactobacillus metriopterae]
MINILYSSITGNNKDIAQSFADSLSNIGVKYNIYDIYNIDPSIINQTDILILVIYTYDEGTIPDESIELYEEIKNSQLSGMFYQLIGSGDIMYGKENFNAALDKFDEVLNLSNAKKISDTLKVNLMMDERAYKKILEISEKLAKNYVF